MALSGGAGEQDGGFSSALARAKRGDGEGFAWLFQNYSRSVGALIRSEACPNHDEVVNTIFFKAFRSIDRFVGNRANFASYLYQIARFQVVDERRAQQRRLPVDLDLDLDLIDAQSDPAASRPNRDATGRVHEAMKALTPEQREVLVLRVYFGLTGPEAAEAMDRPVEAVRSLQGRAEARLRNLVDSGMLAP